MKAPTLQELESTLKLIEEEINKTLDSEYGTNDVRDKGHECGTGSCVMYLDRRKPLYKFFASIPYDPYSFFISIYDKQVSINLRNIGINQSYVMKRTAYDLAVKKLREVYEWEVYNDVRVD